VPGDSAGPRRQGSAQAHPAGPDDAAPSATVVLAREAAHAAEFFLVKRYARATFGASHVFPGGVVEVQDRETHDLCQGLSAADADRCLAAPGAGLDYYSAAIRELFEETGVLLARDAAGRMPPAIASLDHVQQDRERKALLSAERSWPDFLRGYGLTLAADELAYFAWWVTPVARTRRFSTRFFLAEMPAGQAAVHDAGELADGRWLSAETSLGAHEAGELALPPPTLATLRDLLVMPKLGDLRTWARRCEDHGVTAILPFLAGAAGDEQIIMPGEPGYRAPARGGGE
jgi:8-oxo-dGTP pyrophosphatase MutT (NUDIX family)